MADRVIKRSRMSITKASTYLEKQDLYGKNKRYSIKITATIVRLKRRQEWFYYACPRCDERYQTNNELSWCSKCNEQISSPTARLLIRLKVKDRQAKLRYWYTGQHAEELTGLKVNNIQKMSTENKATQKEFRKEITSRIKGYTCVFRLEVTKLTWGIMSFEAKEIMEIDATKKSMKITRASTRKQPNPDVHSDETSSDAEQPWQVVKETTPCLSDMKPWIAGIQQAFKKDANGGEALDDVVALDDNRSKIFRKNLKSYNYTNSFTSLGCQYDK